MQQLRGVLAIPPAVYREDLSVDYEGVSKTVDFCLRCGVHGIVIPVYATEYFLLTTEERKAILETAIRTVDGRVPVIAGVSAAYVKEAEELTAHACAAGADAVIAAPPHVVKVSLRELADYYGRIEQATSVPVIIQNLFPPLGMPMDYDYLLQRLTELEHFSYVKEETANSRQLISRLHQYELEHPDGVLKGVMGGNGSRNLVEEYDRGICATMPSCQFSDLVAAVWNLMEAGDMEGAYEVYSRCLPAFLFSGAYGVGCYKTVLKRRGVIGFDGCRPAGWPLMDEKAHRELDRVLHLVSPLFSKDAPMPRA